MESSLSALHVLHLLLIRACWQMPPPPHSLHKAPDPSVLADASPSFALPALAPLPIVLADAPPSALLALVPLPIVLADARPSALLAQSLERGP